MDVSTQKIPLGVRGFNVTIVTSKVTLLEIVGRQNLIELKREIRKDQMQKVIKKIRQEQVKVL